MAILSKTNKLGLTQYSSNSYGSTLLDRYNADMLQIDTYVSALEITVDERFDLIEADILQFKNDINDSFTEFQSTITSEIDNFETSLNSQMSVFQENINNTVNEYTGLVNTFDERISHLEACCNEATETLNIHQQWLENIQEVIDTVSTANIENLENRLSALEHKVEANSRLISANTEYIQNILRTIESITQHLTEIDQRFVPIESDIVYLKSCCDLVQNTLTEIQNSINTINDLLTGLRTDVDKNRRDIDANATDIITVARQVEINSTNIEEILRQLNGIPDIEQLRTIIYDIDRIKAIIGTDILKTNAQTLTGAINELYDRPIGSTGIRVVYDETTENIKFIDKNGLVVYYIDRDENIIFPNNI